MLGREPELKELAEKPGFRRKRLSLQWKPMEK